MNTTNSGLTEPTSEATLPRCEATQFEDNEPHTLWRDMNAQERAKALRDRECELKAIQERRKRDSLNLAIARVMTKPQI